MTYDELQMVISDAYSTFSASYVINKTIGADLTYSDREMFFAKCIYKVLMHQHGDESLDLLTKHDIQNIIELFNYTVNSTVPIEYI